MRQWQPPRTVAEPATAPRWSWADLAVGFAHEAANAATDLVAAARLAAGHRREAVAATDPPTPKRASTAAHA
jgi:hypothetical protein